MDLKGTGIVFFVSDRRICFFKKEILFPFIYRNSILAFPLDCSDVLQEKLQPSLVGLEWYQLQI